MEPSKPEEIEDAGEDVDRKKIVEEIKQNVKLEKENATQIIIDGQKIKRNQQAQFLTLKDWTDPTFNLKQEIIDALLDEAFLHPSKIQAYSIPRILEEQKEGGFKHMIAQSHNGSGKTLAFLISCLQRVDKTDPSLQILILMPNRELANQTYENIQSINTYTKYDVSIIKGEDKAPKIGQIAITLLNKARQLVKTKKMNLSKLKILCFDEADYFFREQSDTDDFVGFTTMVKEHSSSIQYLFFSATYGDEALTSIKSIVQSHSIKIELPKERLALKGIKQTFIVAKKQAGDGP